MSSCASYNCISNITICGRTVEEDYPSSPNISAVGSNVVEIWRASSFGLLKCQSWWNWKQEVDLQYCPAILRITIWRHNSICYLYTYRPIWIKIWYSLGRCRVTCRWRQRPKSKPEAEFLPSGHALVFKNGMRYLHSRPIGLTESVKGPL